MQAEHLRLGLRPQRDRDCHGFDLFRQRVELCLLLLDLPSHLAQLLADFERVLHRVCLLQDRQILRLFRPQITQVRVLIDVLPSHVLGFNFLALHSQPELANFSPRLLKPRGRHADSQRAACIRPAADLGTDQKTAHAFGKRADLLRRLRQASAPPSRSNWCGPSSDPSPNRRKPSPRPAPAQLRLTPAPPGGSWPGRTSLCPAPLPASASRIRGPDCCHAAVIQVWGADRKTIRTAATPANPISQPLFAFRSNPPMWTCSSLPRENGHYLHACTGKLTLSAIRPKIAATRVSPWPRASCGLLRP